MVNYIVGNEELGNFITVAKIGERSGSTFFIFNYMFTIFGSSNSKTHSVQYLEESTNFTFSYNSVNCLIYLHCNGIDLVCCG